MNTLLEGNIGRFPQALLLRQKEHIKDIKVQLKECKIDTSCLAGGSSLYSFFIWVFCGQSNKASTLVIYDPGVVPD